MVVVVDTTLSDPTPTLTLCTSPYYKMMDVVFVCYSIKCLDCKIDYGLKISS
jgi:hypothetical protein